MMQGDRTRIFFSVIIALLLLFAALFVDRKSSEIDAIKAIDRSGVSLLVNSRSDLDDYPFILDARLVTETSEKLVFDVKYFMSNTIEGMYNISIHPDNSSWNYSANTLEKGMNNINITVSYRPKHIAQKNAVSTKLLFYISHSENNKYMGKVFERTIDFPKTWIK